MAAHDQSSERGFDYIKVVFERRDFEIYQLLAIFLFSCSSR